MNDNQSAGQDREPELPGALVEPKPEAPFWVFTAPEPEILAPRAQENAGRRPPRLLRAMASPLVAVALVSGLVASGATFAVTAVAGRAGSTASSPVTSGTLLSSTSGSLASIIARTTASVVVINVESASGQRGQQVQGVGGGIIVGANGLILTNNHVVSVATSIQVTLPDGRTLAGTVLGVSSTTDLAMVKVGATGLTAASLGTSDGLAVGETVVAIGDPLGEFAGSASAGIISGLNRSIAVEDDNLSGLIQTDAAVNPGNSGGPLIDASGNVIGVVAASSGSAQGISFAIPISAAESMISEAAAGQPIA